MKDQVSHLEGEWLDIQKQPGIAGAPLPLGKSLSKGDKPAKEEIEKIIGRL